MPPEAKGKSEQVETATSTRDPFAITAWNSFACELNSLSRVFSEMARRRGGGIGNARTRVKIIFWRARKKLFFPNSNDVGMQTKHGTICALYKHKHERARPKLFLSGQPRPRMRRRALSCF